MLSFIALTLGLCGILGGALFHKKGQKMPELLCTILTTSTSVYFGHNPPSWNNISSLWGWEPTTIWWILAVLGGLYSLSIIGDINSDNKR